MTTQRQQQTPNKNVGGSQVEDRYLRDSESPAQREARRRAGEPAITPDPDDKAADATVSANKRGGGSHGGSSRGAR